MSDWLHALPVPWMALVVFGTTYFLAAAIFGVVNLLAKAERARAFKAISPGLLPPLGILFGLAVGFVLAFLVAYLQHGYYFEIILPGSIVGALVGWATQRYGAPVSAPAPAR